MNNTNDFEQRHSRDTKVVSDNGLTWIIDRAENNEELWVDWPGETHLCVTYEKGKVKSIAVGGFGLGRDEHRQDFPELFALVNHLYANLPVTLAKHIPEERRKRNYSDHAVDGFASVLLMYTQDSESLQQPLGRTELKKWYEETQLS